MSIFVITDDLTGANDTAVQFSKKGLSTLVFLELPAVINPGKDTEVLVFNTDSRALTPSEAAERVRSTFQSIKLKADDIVYKKIDSTLRGNVVTEVMEALRQSGKEVAIVAPAYPKNGRTTKNGVHYVRGVPVAETEAAKDPRCPIRYSHIPSLFQSEGNLPLSLLPLSIVREGPSSIAPQIEKLAKEGVKIIVGDAETEEDLRQLTEGVEKSERKALWVGSAGLAEAISERFSTQTLPLAIQPSPKPVLLLLGSMSEVSTHQGEVFRRWANTEPFVLHPEELGKDPEKTVRKALEWVLAQLRKGTHAILMSNRHKAEVSPNGTPDPIESILKAFQRIGSTIDLSLCSGLIVTGGDIATAVCRGMGVHSIEVLDETSPGIPLGRIRGGKWEGLPLVTKAGAFGPEDAFILAARRISSISC